MASNANIDRLDARSKVCGPQLSLSLVYYINIVWQYTVVYSLHVIEEVVKLDLVIEEVVMFDLVGDID